MVKGDPQGIKLYSIFVHIDETCDRRVTLTSSSNHMATLRSKSFRFSNFFQSKVGVYVHLAVPYEAKVRNQWTYLAENRAVSSYSHPKATL